MNPIQNNYKLAISTFLLSTAMGTSINVQADQVILDDLIVDGSACIGFDCVNGESFGFDTIRIKENNLRIKAVDTSTTSSFPSNDWQITFNDTSNGGQNKFSIDDIDGGRTPFTIEAGAPSHSLYVDDSGRIGFGTSTPVVDLHVKSGNTPTLRLEQDGSSGFASQTWDMAGNETNFFIRDATNGSTLPIRLRPGAPSSAIDIAADGDVGFGTSSPSSALHVRRTNGSAQITVEDTGTVADGELLLLSNNGKVKLTLNDTSQANDAGTWKILSELTNLQFNNPSHGGQEFELTSTGNLTIGGALTELSSRYLKENIFKIDSVEILETVSKLPITKWNYISDGDSIKHIGPMAQDFHALFGLGKDDSGIASLDTSGIALASIQALNNKLEIKTTEIEEMKENNRQLNDKISKLERTISQLVKENN